MAKNLGAETGTDEVTDPLEQKRLDCEFFCSLENKRLGELDKYDGYNCDLCLNKGYLLKAVPYLNSYSQVKSECRCMKTRRTIRMLKRSGLEKVVHDYTLDNYLASEPWQAGIIRKAREYLSEEQPGWFFFGGTSGCGKTHICTAIAINLLKRGNEVRYMLWRDEVSRLKTIANDPTYSEEIEEYKRVDVLYVDDLFKTGVTEGDTQKPTKADLNLAFEIINARAIRKKITIISSESTLPEIVALDEATGSRISQNCGKYVLNVGRNRNKNYRLKQCASQ